MDHLEEYRKMEVLENAEAIVGYRVKMMQKPAFQVVGFTFIIPPAQEAVIPKLWDEVEADGRLVDLIKASPIPTWVLGMGSWDPECEKHGMRYTICIELTGQTDLRNLVSKYPLFTKQIGASDWMCFKLTHQPGNQRFWQDNPYQMMKKLGYKLNTGDFSIGLHFDAYPPGFDAIENPSMEFWITVKKIDQH
jgi:predicted transcriptional regulator YdeE